LAKKGKLTEDAAKKEVENVKSRIKYSTDVADLGDVDLVIEVRNRASLVRMRLTSPNSQSSQHYTTTIAITTRL